VSCKVAVADGQREHTGRSSRSPRRSRAR